MSDENPTTTIVPVGNAQVAPSGGTSLAEVAAEHEVDRQTRRLLYLAEKSHQIRTALVAGTLPSDWKIFGNDDDSKAYLEGAGAERVAPLIGLKMVSSAIERDEPVLDGDGESVSVDLGGRRQVVRLITITADFESAFFGTRFNSISGACRSDDQFLSQNGRKVVDIEDQRRAAYTRMLGKAVQRLAGLSGVTKAELRDKYGLGGNVKGVNFKGGKTQAKQADAAAGAPGLKEIHRILLKLSGGDEEAAGDILEAITFKADTKDAEGNIKKGWAGKRDPNRLTENGVKYALGVLQKKEAEFDMEEGKE